MLMKDHHRHDHRFDTKKHKDAHSTENLKTRQKNWPPVIYNGLFKFEVILK